MDGDFEAWLSIVRGVNYLPEQDFLCLCRTVKWVLAEESNVVNVETPVSVCGDIHGQFYDLLHLFDIGGHCPDTNYIFLGDIVDRGYYSLECITLLLLYKVLYPHRMTILRGNHESRVISRQYGFYEECITKYGNANPWREVCEVFDLLPIAALIEDDVLCVHGGLSPSISTIDQIRTLQRNFEIPAEGPFSDLVWSDPNPERNGWSRSPRGIGYMFGGNIVGQFNYINNTSLIARAHQEIIIGIITPIIPKLVQEGLQWLWNESLVTVWSAPNYMYRCGNRASILSFDTVKNIRPTFFDAVPAEYRRTPSKVTSPYFL